MGAMMTDSDIRLLAGGTGGVYHFDLSMISGDRYDSLLRTLRKFAITKIDSLGFTCDRLARSEDGLKNSSVCVRNSIAGLKHRFTKDFGELICHVLPRSAHIREIQLSNIKFMKHTWGRICVAMGRATSLESVGITNVPLGTDGLVTMLNLLDPDQIKTICVDSCGLVHEDVDDIVNFIERKEDTEGISTFRVSRKEISPAGLKLIEDALLGYMRVRSIREQRKMELELKALERDNELLKREFEDARKGMDVIEYSEGLYIIGAGAKQFITFFDEVKARVQRLERTAASHHGQDDDDS